MVPRENKNNAYAKFGGTNKDYYGIFRTGLSVSVVQYAATNKNRDFLLSLFPVTTESSLGISLARYPFVRFYYMKQPRMLHF